MSGEKPLVNRVEKSGLITIDLGTLSTFSDIEIFDLKEYLVKELVLMEKPFREALKQTDWMKFADKYVGVYCSNDALVPMWAYMLVTSYLESVARDVFQGDLQHVQSSLLKNAIDKINPDDYVGARVVIKGCGEAIPASAYMDITKKLQPVVKSLMYGEPCSTVPVYKKDTLKTPS